MSTMLKIQDLFAAYGLLTALRGVNLEVMRGEAVAVIGANGAGKSTLLQRIMGQVTPVSGQIIFDGAPIQNLASHQIAKRGIAIVPEGRRLFAHMSVEDNLLIGAKWIPKERQKERVKTLLEPFPQLYERLHRHAGLLSGGEQQLLAILRAVISEPKLILLDEPSLGLAPLRIREVMILLQKIQQQGTTLLIAEQNAKLALSFAQRAYVLSGGYITLQGQAGDLIQDPEVYRAYLGEMSTAPSPSCF